MIMLTHSELNDLRRRLAADPQSVAGCADLIGRLIAQAEYGLDCARLLDEAIHYPAEPYGEAEILVARLTDGFNEIWNRHRYRDAADADEADAGRAGVGAGPAAGGANSPARNEDRGNRGL